MAETPRLDPRTTRLLVVNANYIVTSGSGWPIRMPGDTLVAVPLIGVRPLEAPRSVLLDAGGVAASGPPSAPEGPDAVATTVVFEADLRVGTVDELVEAYREYLEATLAKANQDPAVRSDVAKTASTFADCPSGTVEPLFPKPGR